MSRLYGSMMLLAVAGEGMAGEDEYIDSSKLLMV